MSIREIEAIFPQRVETGRKEETDHSLYYRLARLSFPMFKPDITYREDLSICFQRKRRTVLVVR
jgi:hypothetical protein